MPDTYQLNCSGAQLEGYLALIGNDELITTAQTLTGAINELDGNITAVIVKGVRYFTSQAVSVVSNAEIFRITDANITADTVLLGCVFDDPSAIVGEVTWTSYNGYIAFTGTCTTATTANVTVATKVN